MTFKRTYAEALASHKPMRRSPMQRSTKPMKRSRMKVYRQSPEERALTAEVLKRDEGLCQWPGGCTTGDARIDVHHLAERSQRPDLKLSADNCKAICRTHHDWIPPHRAEAIKLGVLNPETYEAAQKRKASNGTS